MVARTIEKTPLQHRSQMKLVCGNANSGAKEHNTQTRHKISMLDIAKQ